MRLPVLACLALILVVSCRADMTGAGRPPERAFDAAESEAVADETAPAEEQGAVSGARGGERQAQASRPVPPRRTGGFFTMLFGGDRNAFAAKAARSGGGGDARVDESDTSLGGQLPFGQLAKVCGVSGRKLGRKIAQYPERRPLHRLYDSAPGNTGPHSFYLTGFADGCARQFTAALAVFGTVGMHEQLRYGLPAEVQPYSDTDQAYERLKRRICGKPRRKPCGSKIGRLEGDTVFLSVYERFGDNARWANLLLHRGTVYAQDQKSGI